MAYHDGGYALPLEFQDEVQELVALVVVEGTGGLVQDEELHLLGKGPGNFHELLLSDAELAHDGGVV